jgi:hypothetical protein
MQLINPLQVFVSRRYYILTTEKSERHVMCEIQKLRRKCESDVVHSYLQGY